MKKIILVSFGLLPLFACQKEKQEVNSKAENKDTQLMSWNSDLHVSKWVTFKRDYVLNSAGKWDCSKPGDKCEINVNVPDKQKAEMAVLDSYLASNNSSGYFSDENWSILFPQITDYGLNALINNETIMYKNGDSESGHFYVLAANNGGSSNEIIAVWNFAQ